MNTRVTRISNRLAKALAGLIALALPAIYFGLSYQYQAAEALTEATFSATTVSSTVINANPELWQYEHPRLNVLLMDQTPTKLQELRRIVDRDGRVVAQGDEEDVDPPLLMRSAALRDSGREVGRFEVIRSLRPVLMETALAGLVGLLLGGAVLLILRVFPLRALKEALDTLFAEKERAEVTLHSIADAVVTTDAAGRIEHLNPAAETLTGWRREEACGQPIDRVFCVVTETGGEPRDNPALKALATGGAVASDKGALLVQHDGAHLPIEHSAAPIHDRAGRAVGTVLVFRDVSKPREITAMLSYQASHDDLTGLHNRRDFEQRLARAIDEARCAGTQHALCYMDLDQFKIINDTCGHVAGDELLRQLAALLRSKVRASDSLARLGGDEFGLLLESCPPDQAERIAHALIEQVRSFRLTWRQETHSIGLSVGLVCIDRETEDLAQVLSAADAACYAAKEKGRNRLHIYQPNDSDLTVRRGEMQWVARLRRALEEDRLRLYAQTIRPLRPGAEDGLMIEILVRLIDESGEIVAPAAFIPAAERYGLMPAVDRRVIETTFAALNRFRRFHERRLSSCFINLSGLSWSDESLPEYILAQAERHKLPPNMVCFEITETAAITNLANTVAFIHKLGAQGFRFALDDFGSGMSSFGYLRQLPVDILKIDGGFVRNMATDKIDQAMVDTINRIGHTMGIQTIAEFVESAEILARLETLGVDYAQGYAISRPQPLESVLADSGQPPLRLISTGRD